MPPVIRVDGLGKTYGGVESGVPALCDLSFSIARSDYVAVMGTSGSGKSTLLNLLGLLDVPSIGRYFLEDRDVMHLSDTDRSALRNDRIGFVFQNFNLLASNTVRENVELPMIYAGVPCAERRRRAEEALVSVGLDGKIDKWSHQLSGGEQQRVSIARAVVNRPSIVLADEPTGALDSVTGHAIMALLRRLNDAGTTIILVTHDVDVACQAKRVLTMHDGRLMSDESVSVELPQAQPVQATGSDNPGRKT